MSHESFAAEQLMAQAGALRALARDILQDEHSAEDVVQETFRLAIEEGRGREIHSPGGWLQRVARNLAFNRRRSDRHRRLREERSSQPESTPGEGSQVTQECEWMRASLLEAMDSLAPTQREALRLRYLEDLSPPQIAARLEVSPNTIKTRLRRGRAELRESLERRDGGRTRSLRALGLLAMYEEPRPLVGAALSWSMLGLFGLLCSSLLIWFNWARGDERLGGDPKDPIELAGRDDDESSPLKRTLPDLGERVEATAGPRADSVEASTGRLVLHLEWRDGGGPAAGIRVSLHPQSCWPDGVVLARSDRAGRVEVELPVGTVIIRSDRGEVWSEEVLTKECVERNLRMPKGVTVEGRVLDGWGQPIVGAEIWLYLGGTDWLGGSAVATTDGLGAFEVLGVSPGATLCARAGNFAPAEPLDLDILDPSASPWSVELRMDRRGGRVQGTVLDPDGRAIEGARVAIGPHRPLAEARPDGSLVEVITPELLSTDARGGFRSLGTETGDIDVSVMAEGYPIKSERLHLGSGDVHELRLQLSAPGAIEGVVQDSTGSPRVGVLVGVVSEASHRVYANPTISPGESCFDSPAAWTDEHGSFRLSRLPEGVVHLSAWDPIDRAQAHTRLELRSGEVANWEPRLELGHCIRGRVEDQDGQPLSTLVRAQALDDSGEVRVVGSDPDGEFCFTSLRDVEYGLVLESERYAFHPAKNPRWRSRPNGEELRLARKPEHSALGLGRVVGSLKDEGHRLETSSGLTFWLQTEGELEMTRGQGEGLEYRFEHVPSGRHRVLALVARNPVAMGGWFDLAAGEAPQLPQLLTRRGGSLHVQLEPHPDLELQDVRGFLAWSSVYHQVALSYRDGEFFGDNLEAGRHRLWVVGQGLAHEMRWVEIESGTHTAVVLECDPGTERFFEVRGSSAVHWSLADIQLFDEAGELTLQWLHIKAGASDVIRWSFWLRAGKYRLKVTTDTGLELETELDFPDLAPLAGPIRLKFD